MNILVIGCVTTDLLMQVDRFARADEEIRAAAVQTYDGGSGANVAVGVSRLGKSAAFMGCIGDDAEGARQREVLLKEGVDISRVFTSRHGLRTAHVVGLVQPTGERQLYFHGGAAEEITPADVTAELLDGIDCVHVSTLGPEFAERVLDLRRSRVRPLILSVDPGCVGLAGPRMAHVRAILPQLDLLFVNEVEFTQLFGHVAPDDLVATSMAALPERMAIKVGDRGAYLFARSEGVTHHGAFHVNAVDSTGAGDAFAAGYLAGLVDGLSSGDLGPFANAVAALETRCFGCRDGLPTIQRAQRFVRDGS